MSPGTCRMLKLRHEMPTATKIDLMASNNSTLRILFSTYMIYKPAQIHLFSQ